MVSGEALTCWAIDGLASQVLLFVVDRNPFVPGYVIRGMNNSGGIAINANVMGCNGENLRPSLLTGMEGNTGAGSMAALGGPRSRRTFRGSMVSSSRQTLCLALAISSWQCCSWDRHWVHLGWCRWAEWSAVMPSVPLTTPPSSSNPFGVVHMGAAVGSDPFGIGPIVGPVGGGGV